jgi:hypothetical protein
MFLAASDVPLNIEAISSSATMMADQIAILRSSGLPLGSCSSFIIYALFCSPGAMCHRICRQCKRESVNGNIMKGNICLN